MTNKDSLSHATCIRADTVFLHFYETKLSLQIAPLAFSIFHQFLLSSRVFPSLPILILFLTCAAKRGSQLSKGLSSAIRAPVLCSAEILRVLNCHFNNVLQVMLVALVAQKVLSSASVSSTNCTGSCGDDGNSSTSVSLLTTSAKSRLVSCHWASCDMSSEDGCFVFCCYDHCSHHLRTLIRAILHCYIPCEFLKNT